MDVSPYPWQQPLFDHFADVLGDGRLPHAILLTGPEGLGKSQLVNALSARLLCRRAQGHAVACGACHDCRMLLAGHHPDVLRVHPADKGKMIRVDAVRDISAFVSQTAQQGGYRVIDLSPAERMNTAAANALLKSLEEPGARTVFLLSADIVSRVMPTIRSRCQQWKLPLPERQQGLEWLTRHGDMDAEEALFWWDVAGGVPLQARMLAEPEQRRLRQQLQDSFDALIRGGDPVAEAARLDKGALGLILHYGITWLEDLIRLGTSGDEAGVRNRDLMPLYRQAIKNGRVRDWFKLLDYAREQRRLVARGANPNPQLVYEAWLIRWAALLRS
ncbi:DNA polymerase III subunit delta' [Larsenimonas rhizosphaerae]|uniref:DNA polymerase III subunit delta' n=1 Tax=Larsenimonas rhizosphaerae TaxID=2944682 RepID=A0AA41ZKH6_9GAMM|nr:DNA polymerase III subunit delta' [Larsenimonas rhizosphaerae]MCM2130956.1 DNA polymerase III subunit delta' [Larsenimonas rhizosphaerae]MCX2523661.1 DNA polymerase III subunit delta' [Larsenimonas rhizosphaerae]